MLGCAQKLTKKIYRALAHTGQRAIIQRGWAKLGMIPNAPLPPNVHVIDSVPHDWLFPLCSGVVHHGARSRLWWMPGLSQLAWQDRWRACLMALLECVPPCHDG